VKSALTDEQYRMSSPDARRANQRVTSKSLNNLRITFNQNLARLYNPATQEKGYLECKKLM
jgi:hypothetical protein